MTSKFVTFRNKVEALFSHGLTELEKLFAPLEAELGPIVEQDLKEIGQAGATAALSAVAAGGSFDLNHDEAALVTGLRAAKAVAVAKGLQLSTQALATVAAGSSKAN